MLGIPELYLKEKSDNLDDMENVQLALETEDISKCSLPNQLNIIDEILVKKNVAEPQLQHFNFLKSESKENYPAIDSKSLEEFVKDLKIIELPQSAQIFSIPVSLPHIDTLDVLISKLLEDNGFSKNIKEYGYFFATMIENTIKPINKELVKLEHLMGDANTSNNSSNSSSNSSGSQNTRREMINHLADSDEIKKQIGIISKKQCYIFEPTEISNAVTHFFLQEAMQNPQVVNLFYQDGVRKGSSRCMTILPCEIIQLEGSAKIVVFVSISGKAQAEKKDELHKLHQGLKQFSKSLKFNLNNVPVEFHYVEHSSTKYDWLLHESNRLITTKEMPLQTPHYELPNNPMQPCAEKKVFSELAKHVIHKKESQIKVLGETNVHVPKKEQWNNPHTQKENLDIKKINLKSNSEFELNLLQKEAEELEKQNADKKRSGLWFIGLLAEYNNRRKEPKSAFYDAPLNDDLFNQIHEEFSKYFQSDVPQFDKEVAGKIKSYLLKMKTIKSVSTDDKLFVDMLNSQDFSSHLGQILSGIGKLLPQNQKKNQQQKIRAQKLGDLKSTSKIVAESEQPIFIIESKFNAGDSRNSKDQSYYYAFESREACEHCQKQKFAYLAVLFHAAQLDWNKLTPTLFKEFSEKSDFPEIFPNILNNFHSCRKQENCLSSTGKEHLRLSAFRCNF